jgi:hypothetical protein
MAVGIDLRLRSDAADERVIGWDGAVIPNSKDLSDVAIE